MQFVQQNVMADRLLCRFAMAIKGWSGSYQFIKKGVDVRKEKSRGIAGANQSEECAVEKFKAAQINNFI